jgi:hypothetical protein
VRADVVVPPELRALWRQRAEVLATNLANGSREHREIAHAAGLIRQDYHDRFLIELLQNANDQALVGGVRDSTVVIVRTERLLAVANGGQAVTARNLERLSSLADSDKTGVLVGNKGVGFKAVYHVTDAPEIYSASAERAGSVFADFRVGLALERRPFQHLTLRAAVEEDVATFFRENAGLARALRARGIEDPVGAVRSELEHVAGFKFPLARDSEDLTARLDELRIPEGERESIRTLVVLPLHGQRASDDVSRAIDRLVSGGRAGEAGQAELALLFLAGVSKIVVIDHARGANWSFFRAIHAGTPSDATITVTDPGGLKRSDRFWLLQRDALEGAAHTVARRREIVVAALREFGLEAWSHDDPLPVTIALPTPGSVGAGALGPAGRFCLGLPTQQPTGLPLHVDARFFGTISRTGLDFALPYNAMLLEFAGELLGELLSILRGSPRIEERRAVTLALHRTEGGLADRAFAPGGVADGDVVLAWGGQRFVARGDCRMPSPGERVAARLRSRCTYRPGTRRWSATRGGATGRCRGRAGIAGAACSYIVAPSVAATRRADVERRRDRRRFTPRRWPALLGRLHDCLAFVFRGRGAAGPGVATGRLRRTGRAFAACLPPDSGRRPGGTTRRWRTYHRVSVRPFGSSTAPPCAFAMMAAR